MSEQRTYDSEHSVVADVVDQMGGKSTFHQRNSIALTLNAVEAAGYRILPVEIADPLTGQMTERAIGAIRDALNALPNATKVPSDAPISVAYAHSSESYARGFNAGFEEAMSQVDSGRSCRGCGCTDDDCSNCLEMTGESCYWVAWDLCSSCAMQVAS